MSQPETDSDIIVDSKKSQTRFGLPRIAIDYLQMVSFNGMVALLSFLTTSLLLYFLGSAGYGEIVSLTSLSLMLAILGGDWTAQAMVRYGTEEFVQTQHVEKVFWNRYYLVVTGVTVLLILSPFWGGLLQSWAGLPPAGILFVLAYLPVQTLWLHLQRILPAINRHRWRYPLLALERLTVILLIAILYCADRLTVRFILPAYILGSLTCTIIITWVIRSKIKRPGRPDPATLKKIWLYSWPLIPTSIVGLLSTNTLDYIILRRYSGLADLGVYALAVQISGLVQQAPQIAGDLTSPRFVRMRLNNDKQAFDHFIQNQVRWLLWAWSCACFFGALLVSQVGPMFIPQKYLALCDLVWPLSVVTSVVPLWYVVWNPLLIAYERVRVVMWSSIATGIMNISMNLILIPQYGVVGCAWATVIAFTTTPLFAEFWTLTKQDTALPRRGIQLYLPSALLIVVVLAIQGGLQ